MNHHDVLHHGRFWSANTETWKYERDLPLIIKEDLVFNIKEDLVFN